MTLLPMRWPMPESPTFHSLEPTFSRLPTTPSRQTPDGAYQSLDHSRDHRKAARAADETPASIHAGRCSALSAFSRLVDRPSFWPVDGAGDGERRDRDLCRTGSADRRDNDRRNGDEEEGRVKGPVVGSRVLIATCYL
jgi:hypothetical protein